MAINPLIGLLGGHMVGLSPAWQAPAASPLMGSPLGSMVPSRFARFGLKGMSTPNPSGEPDFMSSPSPNDGASG